MHDSVALHNEVVNIEMITGIEQFHQIERAWQALWTASNSVSPFQSHPWIAAWASHIDDSYQLRIAVLRRDDRLVAVLPMAIHRFHGLRIMEWAAQCVTDYCDGLGSPADLMATWIAVQQAGDYDLIRLKNIPRGANVQFLADCVGLTFAEDEEVPCLKMLSDHASSEAWLKSMTSKKRTLYKRRQRLLSERGTVTLTNYNHVPDALIIETLHGFKMEWLATRNEGSYLFNNGPARFVSLVQALAKVGRLYLSVLTCHGAIVAGSISIIQGDTFMVFFTTYDPAFGHASPGSLLMLENMKYAIDTGCRVIDFMRGAEAYKREWANAEMRLCSVMGTATWRGHFAIAAHRLRPVYFAARNRLRSLVAGAATAD